MIDGGKITIYAEPVSYARVSRILQLTALIQIRRFKIPSLQPGSVKRKREKSGHLDDQTFTSYIV